MRFLFDSENLVVIIVGGLRPAATAASGLPALAGEGLFLGSICASPVCNEFGMA